MSPKSREIRMNFENSQRDSKTGAKNRLPNEVPVKEEIDDVKIPTPNNRVTNKFSFGPG